MANYGLLESLTALSTRAASQPHHRGTCFRSSRHGACRKQGRQLMYPPGNLKGEHTFLLTPPLFFTFFLFGKLNSKDKDIQKQLHI